MEVLIIDDDVDDCEMFFEAVKLVNPSIECKIASTCMQALQMLYSSLHRTPNYIFLDLHMPVIGGVECLRAIKEHPQLSHIPVFIYSSIPNPRDLADVRNLGAVFFEKPNMFQSLVISLESVLK